MIQLALTTSPNEGISCGRELNTFGSLLYFALIASTCALTSFSMSRITGEKTLRISSLGTPLSTEIRKRGLLDLPCQYHVSYIQYSSRER
jgi:hypothetical protein